MKKTAEVSVLKCVWFKFLFHAAAVDVGITVIPSEIRLKVFLE